MKSYILDTSALIAYIFKEKGGDNVVDYLEYPIISSVNYCEIVTFILKNGSSLDFLEDFLEAIPLEIIDFDEEQAVIAAELRSKTKSKGLSLGDRACLALAMVKKIPVVTADKIGSKLDIDVNIKLIR